VFSGVHRRRALVSVRVYVRARAPRSRLSRFRPTGALLGGPTSDYVSPPCGRRHSRQRCSQGRRADRAAAAAVATVYCHIIVVHSHDLQSRNIITIIHVRCRRHNDIKRRPFVAEPYYYDNGARPRGF